VQILGIQNKPEEQGPTGNRKNMIKNLTLLVGVMKSYFGDRIESFVPDNRFGNDSHLGMIKA
jgi:hypothetical protein